MKHNFQPTRVLLKYSDSEATLLFLGDTAEVLIGHKKRITLMRLCLTHNRQFEFQFPVLDGEGSGSEHKINVT